MALKQIETRAIISAQDHTGTTFAQVAQKLKRMEQAASQANARAERAAHVAGSNSVIRHANRDLMNRAVQTGAAVVASSHIARQIVRQASSRLHEDLRMETAGMSRSEIAAAHGEAEKLAREFKPIGQTEIMHMLRNMRSVVGTYEEAQEIARPLMQLRVLAQHASPHAGAGQINEEFDQLIKSAEISGVTKHLDEFTRYMEGIAKAINVFGDTIKPHQYFEAAQYGRAATMNLSEEFRAGVLPTLIQHHGGSQAGTALASLYQALVGGKMSNVAVQEFNKLGLLDPSKVVKTKTGNVKGIAPGGIRGSDLARTDPDRWVAQYLVPALARKGITDPGKISEVIAHMFSNRVAAQLVTEMITQKAIFDKDRELVRGAHGLEAARTIMAQDFDQSVISAKNALDSLAASLGKPFMQPLTDGANKFATAVNSAAAYLDRDRNAAGHAALGVLGAGAGISYLGGAAALGAFGVGAGVSAAFLPIMAAGGLALGSSYYVTRAAWDAHNLPQRDLKDRREAANVYADLEQQLERARRRGRADKIAEIEDQMASARYRMGDWRPRSVAGSRAFDGLGLNAFGDGSWTPSTGKRRRVGLGEALPDMPRTFTPTSHDRAVPQEQKVDVTVRADPMEIKNMVVVTSSDALLAIVDGAKEARRLIDLHTSASGRGSHGSTDAGMQQQ